MCSSAWAMCLRDLVDQRGFRAIERGRESLQELPSGSKHTVAGSIRQPTLAPLAKSLIRRRTPRLAPYNIDNIFKLDLMCILDFRNLISKTLFPFISKVVTRSFNAENQVEIRESVSLVQNTKFFLLFFNSILVYHTGSFNFVKNSFLRVFHVRILEMVKFFLKCEWSNRAWIWYTNKIITLLWLMECLFSLCRCSDLRNFWFF